jgi:hypothetical protein
VTALYGGKLIAACLRLPRWDSADHGLGPEMAILDGEDAWRATADGVRSEL